LKPVCFIGVDGAGKTSIARLYAERLERLHGRRARVVWLRGTHTAASLAARLLHRLGARGSCNPYYGVCVPHRLRRAWAWLEVFSLAPVAFTRLIAPRLLGRLVVGDRGPLDLIPWIAVTLGEEYSGGLVAAAVRLLSKASCKPIYVRASLETLLERRRGSRDEELIVRQLEMYDRLAGELGIPVIDTTGKTPEEAVEEAARIIGEDC